MKRLILFAVLLVVPLLADAQQGDTLLTPDGKVFSVQFERAEEHPEIETASSAYLTLTTRHDGDVAREIVPATLEKGSHFNPAIAYDDVSGMLFVFWIHHSSMASLSNQLMFASRDAEGIWAEARSFGALYDTRRNLRLAVTRKYEDANGELQSGLSVHLAWWEFDFTTARASARYALATIDEGRVTDIYLELKLDTFLPKNLEPAAEAVDENVLNQPVLFPSPKQDSILLVYGDVPSGTMHTLRIRPKIGGDGLLRVPGGKRETGFKSPTLNAGDSRIEGVYGDDDRMAFYANENGKLRYVVLKDGQWSASHAITLDEQLTSGDAVNALRRLVNEH